MGNGPQLGCYATGQRYLKWTKYTMVTNLLTFVNFIHRDA